MPTYNLKCVACGFLFEEFLFHPMHASIIKCAKCGNIGSERQIGEGSGFVFKGDGFYVTDNKSDRFTSDQAMNSGMEEMEKKLHKSDAYNELKKPKNE